MKNTIKEMLENEIRELLETVNVGDLSSEEYEEAMIRLEGLYKILSQEKEIELNTIKAENELLVKIRELRDSKVMNGIKVGVEVAAVVAPLVFYGIWMKKGLQFEETGALTSTTFKGLVSKFKPTK